MLAVRYHSDTETEMAFCFIWVHSVCLCVHICSLRVIWKCYFLVFHRAIFLCIFSLKKKKRHWQNLESEFLGVHPSGKKLLILWLQVLIFGFCIWCGSSGGRLQFTLEQFTAACDAARMRTSTSMSETTDLCQVECPVRVKLKLLPQMGDFSVYRALVEWDADRGRQRDRSATLSTSFSVLTQKNESMDISNINELSPNVGWPLPRDRQGFQSSRRGSE